MSTLNALINDACLAIPDEVLQKAEELVEKLALAMKEERPPAFVPPVFVPKAPNLPKLSSYEADFPDEYWQLWPVNPLKFTPEPWISTGKLWSLGWRQNYPDLYEVCVVAEYLTNGARIGAQGASRLPAIGKNLEGAIRYGYQCMDAIHDWIQKDLIMGPFKPDEIPIERMRISPLNVEIKPNSRKYLINE